MLAANRDRSARVLTLIEGGDVYAPDPLGRQPVLLVDGRIGRVGEVDRTALRTLGLDLETIDASGCVVVPGIIDPHEHLLGGSGEEGFHSQTPQIFLDELVAAGITTVVGCLGVDTTMKTLPGLLARVKGLRHEGLDVWMWTGGYNVPPTTVTDSVRNDIMFLAEVIGCGEVAISDERATDPAPRELARLVHDAYVGGMLSGKAGLTHVHVGEGDRRLRCIREVLDRERFQVRPEWLYLTHVQRNEPLLAEAIELAHEGVAVDFDVAAHDLAKWLRCYIEDGGPLDRLTFSSDADGTRPGALLDQIRDCVLRERFALEEVLPHVTANTARILGFEDRGRLAQGLRADLLVLDRESLEPVQVIAGGRRLMRDGRVAVTEGFLEQSDRQVVLEGKKSASGD
ncbi:MAG TPA: amidohydrolase family protein [Gemmatimonadales bacterium]|nr:amidohydrolase family protein [Gemmatimonadales bacterium]